MRIGISTGGGDCPGLNAVIRAAVKTAVGDHGWEVVGIEDGLRGLLDTGKTAALSPARVRDILARGGTILGTTNRGNPFEFPVEVDGEIELHDISDRVMARIEQLGIDCMIFVGGDGTQAIAQRFREKGLNVVGVPKTIDNDLSATDYTFGFDTAVTVAVDALDRLHTTGESHDRVMLLEVMGRHAGWIALHAGIAGGADVILIPEIPYDPDEIVDKLQRRSAAGITYSTIVVAEGAYPVGGEPSYGNRTPTGAAPKLEGAAQRVAGQLEERASFETRVTVLGHIQRGGSPTAFDRILGTRFGYHAVELIAEGAFGRMVALRGTEITSVDIREAVEQPKYVDPDGQLVAAAKASGSTFGASE